MDDIITPAPTTEDAGQVTTVTPDQSADSGQGEGGAETPNQAPTYEERLSEFYAKKGWDIEKTPAQLLDSYEQLEGKLGNWQEIEQRAQKAEVLEKQLSEATEKAQRWERAQEELKTLEQQNQIQKGTFDFSKAPTDQLARLWTQGQIGLADIPPARQFEVQKFAAAQEAAFETHVKKVETDLREKHPILNDPDIEALVAQKITANPTIEPEEIIKQIEAKFQQAEKKGEERIKQDMEKVKQGNLERPGSPISTKANIKVRSVAEAMRYAQEQHAD